MLSDITNLCITPEYSVHQALAQMDVNRMGIVLVVDDQHRLIGTITDGDMRRAVLAAMDLEQPVTELLAQKDDPKFAQPVTAPVAADSDTLLEILNRYRIRHLPLIDQDQRVVALATMDEFVADQGPPVQAVIMAGGLGLRLKPLTDDLPKPMLPVGGQPLMETTIYQLRSAGIKNVSIAVGHLSDKITDHFGDGRRFGVDISYVTESRPLGTAGALGLMDQPQETVLVINGDIRTDVDFRSMLAFHREHSAELTVAVHKHDIEVPYGVIESEGAFVRSITEKPTLNMFVNAGIYLLEPSVYRFIPRDKPCDMTDVIRRLVSEGLPVVSFPIREYWIDIGQHTDYLQAQEDFQGEAASS